MAKLTLPLTNTQVSNAKPRDKEYSLADGKGLALRIKTNGTRLWIFNYSRPYTKKRANMSFGVYPELTLADARKERDKSNSLLAQNIDPKQHRDEKIGLQALAHENTLLRVAEQWHKVKMSKVSADHAQDIWRSLELHLFPSLGKVPIHKITAPNTINALRPLAAKGSLETVKRQCQRINEIMVYAVNSGLIPVNPLAGIKESFSVPQKKHQPTIKPEELPELMRRLSRANIKLTTRCLIEWELHTMVRPSEAAGAKWDEIDMDKCLWDIPAERMKKRRAHSVPLSPQMLALLDVMSPVSKHREYIFPSDRNPKVSINKQTANMALRRMGYEGKLVAHGLRSLASTVLNEQQFSPDVVEAALAHVDQNGTRGDYNNAVYIEPRRKMMCWWSDYIESAAHGNLGLARTSKNILKYRRQG
jgi:integrase